MFTYCSVNDGSTVSADGCATDSLVVDSYGGSDTDSLVSGVCNIHELGCDVDVVLSLYLLIKAVKLL